MTIFTDGMIMPRGPQFLEDVPAPAGAYIGAVASDAFMSTSKDLSKVLSGSGFDASAPATSPGGLLGTFETPDTSKLNLPDVGPPDTMLPMKDAQERVKKEGLEGLLTLPTQDDIGARHLDIMLNSARSKAERELTLQRGTEGFVPNAMAMGTSFLVGALDPVNLASAFVPIIGEARYAKLMASAGESVLKRAGTRAAVGAVEGAAGQAMIEPILWKARTQDGKDYGMADVLHNLIFGAVLGGALHSGGGLAADFLRRRRAEPLYPYGPRDPMAVAADIPAPPQVASFSVMDDAYEQLRSTGMRDEEAQANAAIVAARYQTRAERLGDGRSGDDLYRAEGLSIRSGSDMTPEGERVGTEKIGDGELAQRQADAPLKAKAEQKLTMDEGLFGDGAAQKTLFQSAPRLFDLEKPSAGSRVVKVGDTELTYSVDKDTVDLAMVKTDEALREAGSARKALEKLTEEADAAGKRITLNADPMEKIVKKKRLEDFYKSLGFVRNKGSKRDFTTRAEYIREPKARTFNQSNSAPTFYSALDNAVTATKQEKAPAEQWIGTLKNTAGVKAEELQWLGVEDWLKEQKGPVTKQQLQDYIRANQVEVKEVTKGARVPPTAEETTDLNALERRFSDKDMTLKADDAERFAELKMKRDQLEQSDQPTKFNDPKLVLPGGENYRELLLTLPRNSREANDHGNQAAAKSAELQEKYGERFMSTTPVGELDEYSRLINEAVAREDAAKFRTGHFGEANVLAHVRFNERTVDGKKTLFIEEVQSDWHQKGKRQGYVEKGEKSYDVYLDELYKKYFKEVEPERRDISDLIKAASDEEWSKLESLKGEGRVPDAPFKTTWPELAMKRMIRYAAEHGYEKIGWTTGEQQAARYDLSKQISRIRTYGEGAEMKISAWDKSDKAVMDLQPTSPEKLSDMIGKDAADKLMAKKPDKNAGMREISGLELKVGGEGMKGFYDQILPSTVNKLVKKFGGKVEQGLLKADNAPEHVVEEWAARDPSHPFVQKNRMPVHTLDLTPDLKKVAIERGFPLFQGGDNPRGRITLDHAKATVELFAARDASTFMHETGHLWLDELVRDATHATAPVGLKDDMATVLKWLEVEKAEDIGVAQHEKWAQGFEQYLSEGRAPSKALTDVFERFKDWLKTVYQNMRQLGAPVNDEIRGVMDRMLANDRDIAQMIAELPPRAKEDAIRGAIANVISGDPVRVGEMLYAGAGADPRIAAAIAPARQEVMPKAVKEKQPVSLFRFLAMKGGIKMDPEIMEIFDGARPFIPGVGPLLRKNGLSLDYAREAAVEAGYLQDAAAGFERPTESTLQHLIDAIDDEMRGNKRYAHGIDAPVAAHLNENLTPDEHLKKLSDDLDYELTEAGLDPKTIPEKDRRRTLQIMQKEGIMDPGVAYERAVMEATEDISDATGQKHRPENIPGWDISDDTGTTPADGQLSAGLRPSGAGATARERGPADRAPPGQGVSAEAWRDLATRTPDFDEPELLAASEAAAKAKDYAHTNLDDRLNAALAHEAEGEATYLMFENTLPEAERQRLNDALNGINAEVATREQAIKKGMGCMTLSP